MKKDSDFDVQHGYDHQRNDKCTKKIQGGRRVTQHILWNITNFLVSAFVARHPAGLGNLQNRNALHAGHKWARQNRSTQQKKGNK